MAFREIQKPVRFVDAETLAHAFLHSENRKVDKSGCISFMGKKYEVGLLFIGRKVQVVYDPADITEVTIEHEGHPLGKRENSSFPNEQESARHCRNSCRRNGRMHHGCFAVQRNSMKRVRTDSSSGLLPNSA